MMAGQYNIRRVDTTTSSSSSTSPTTAFEVIGRVALDEEEALLDVADLE